MDGKVTSAFENKSKLHRHNSVIFLLNVKKNY